jgi:hypothetical protein
MPVVAVYSTGLFGFRRAPNCAPCEATALSQISPIDPRHPVWEAVGFGWKSRTLLIAGTFYLDVIETVAEVVDAIPTNS